MRISANHSPRSGSGRRVAPIAKNHFGAIERHAEEMRLVAVCDTNPATLKAHTETLSVPGYSRLADMLPKERPDLVALCTRSGIHPDQTILAARHGVHVMTEKPMATRWQDGVRMVKTFDESGVYLFVVKQNRRNATLQLLKRAIEEKRFGKIHLVQINVRPPDLRDYVLTSLFVKAPLGAIDFR